MGVALTVQTVAGLVRRILLFRKSNRRKKGPTQLRCRVPPYELTNFGFAI
jgi:hypothetical protein